MSYGLYCIPADFSNLISAAGVNLRIDDVPPTFLGDVIGYASDDIDGYLAARYRLVLQANNNSWIRRRCAEMGIVNLCERRGNPVPGALMTRYEQAIKRLEAIQAGRWSIPDAAETKPSVPVLSQGRTILTPLGPVTAIERSRSTGNAQGYTRRDDPLDWGWFWPLG